MSAAEEFDPKKRLVGAGILIGLAVIILPVILDGDDGSVAENNSDQTQIIEALRNEYVSSDEEVTIFISKITAICFAPLLDTMALTKGLHEANQKKICCVSGG